MEESGAEVEEVEEVGRNISLQYPFTCFLYLLYFLSSFSAGAQALAVAKAS